MNLHANAALSWSGHPRPPFSEVGLDCARWAVCSNRSRGDFRQRQSGRPMSSSTSTRRSGGRFAGSPIVQPQDQR